MAIFSIAVNLLLLQEGGLVFDPVGGWTNFGISQAAYPNLNIQALTRADAIAIYQRDYWAGGNIHSQRVGNLLLSMCVDFGKFEGIKLLQQAVGVAQDGVMGSITETAVNVRGGQTTLIDYSSLCLMRYIAISYPNGTQGSLAINLLGWCHRVEECVASPPAAGTPSLASVLIKKPLPVPPLPPVQSEAAPILALPLALLPTAQPKP